MGKEVREPIGVSGAVSKTNQNESKEAIQATVNGVVYADYLMHVWQQSLSD